MGVQAWPFLTGLFAAALGPLCGPSRADIRLQFPDSQVSSKPIIEFRARKGLPGHAFVLIGKELDNGDVLFYGAGGFYPQKGSKLQSVKNILSGPGTVTYKWDDLSSDVSFRVYATDDQIVLVNSLMRNWNEKTYALALQNCTNMMRNVAEALDLNGADFSVVSIAPYQVVERLSSENSSTRPVEAAARDQAYLKTKSRIAALTASNDLIVMSSAQQDRRAKLYLEAVHLVELKAADDDRRRSIRETRDNISSLYKQFKNIQDELRLAEEQEKKAAEFRQKLHNAMTAVQIASLAAQAKEALPGSTIKGDETAAKLAERVAEYETECQGYVYRYRTKFEVLRRLTNEEMARLKPMLGPTGDASKDLDFKLP